MKQMRLGGAVALITGGSRGLGLTLARQLADKGCHLVLLARDPRELRLAEEELAPRTRVFTIACDVSDRSAVEEAVALALGELGHIDILINNASIIQVGPVAALRYADFRRAMEVDFWGTVHATLAVLPHMRERGSGRICNITSIGGKIAVPHLLPYDCAKFATVGFSEGLHAELAQDGIIVTTVIPGLMRTGSAENVIVEGQREAEYAWFAAGAATPLTAMSVDRAARRIIRAIVDGEAEVTLSWQARLARALHAVSPALVMLALAWVGRLLPKAPVLPTRPRRARDLPQRSSLMRNLIGGVARRTHQYVS
jgi:short-subunit dehydrogenase